MDKETRILIEIIDLHHRTLTNSKLHDPENSIDFYKCPCLPCKKVSSFLEEIGITPNDIDKFLMGEGF